MKSSFFFLSLFVMFFLIVSCASQTDVPLGSPTQNTETSDAIISSDLPAYTGDLYLIDTHAHILPRDKEQNDAFLASLVAAAENAGVSKIMLGLHARHEPDRDPTYSEEHDTWVLEAAEKYPDVIIPMLAGFDPADPEAVSYVEEQLKTGKWKGIGELDLRNEVKKTTTPMNDPTMMEIYKLAATYDVPVMVHYSFCYETDCDSGKAEYEEALEENPETIFIHAHNCPDEMMKKYANLYCEPESIASMLPDAAYIDRVILVTDVQHDDLKVQQNYNYEEFIAAVREKIETLDAEDAEKVAHGTAEEVFKLS